MRSVLAAILLASLCAVSHAAAPVYVDSKPTSDYKIVQDTVTISSTTVTTIAAVSGYRCVYLGDPLIGSTVYYRIDGSTRSVPTVGDWFVPSAKGAIEYNGVINLQLGAGVSSVVLRRKTLRNR